MIGNILQAELEELIHTPKWDDLRTALSALLEAADIAEASMNLVPKVTLVGHSMKECH